MAGANEGFESRIPRRVPNDVEFVNEPARRGTNPYQILLGFIWMASGAAAVVLFVFNGQLVDAIGQDSDLSSQVTNLATSVKILLAAFALGAIAVVAFIAQIASEAVLWRLDR